MATSNSMNDPKTAKADEASIQDVPESNDFRELTPDEEENIVGGCNTCGCSVRAPAKPEINMTIPK